VQRFAGAERQWDVAAEADELGVGDVCASHQAARQVVEEVHAHHGQRLWGFLRRLGLRDEEADEVVQEALLRLWQACSGGTSVERPPAWAFRTAYRLAMDQHRLRRRWQAFLARQAPVKADSRAVQDELLSVWAEVDRLPERQRQVIYLRYRADLTFEDIGNVLGMEPASARSNVSRGIAALRKRLGEEED
jgi:RNA polymerase sigma-70 factor (ECF subfamily)